MNDEIKEILMDLIDYYNVIGTEDDSGFETFADVVKRASKALEHHAIKQKDHKTPRSLDIDPFSIDSLEETSPFKHESDLY